MRVGLATNVLSLEFMADIDAYCSTSNDPAATQRLSGLRRFVLLCHQAYKEFQDPKAIYSSADARFAKMARVLRGFEQWHDGVEFIPHDKCWYDLKLTLSAPVVFTRFYLENPMLPQFRSSTRGRGGLGENCINLTQWNQDCCEHHFQDQRSQSGATNTVHHRQAQCNYDAACTMLGSVDKSKGNTNSILKPNALEPLQRTQKKAELTSLQRFIVQLHGQRHVVA